MTRNMSAPLIRRLIIKRFRGIETLDWNPKPGVNFILGGGDVGKTTILDAIPNIGIKSLLLTFATMRPYS